MTTTRSFNSDPCEYKFGAPTREKSHFPDFHQVCENIAALSQLNSLSITIDIYRVDIHSPIFSVSDVLSHSLFVLLFISLSICYSISLYTYFFSL